MVAATTAVAAAAWFSSDIAAHDVASGSWPLAQPAPTERPSLDGRLAVLRRMADSAAEPPPDDAPTRPAATELQAILRRAAEHRLNRRSDGAPLPPDLASYLTATPAPRVPIDQLDRLLTRIEEL
ncbi:hypothetical protein [Demetria terragena]|uniref:hypothetical protein n=1 Tax=Demetria terragena TaxID=63959 RepID=UPI0003A98057|nr:hypothetical protein [Demetria terragena]